MIIEKVILHKYKRFKLLGVNTVVYTPGMSNIILGTNGSGKSSLVSRLTPIPANKKDFDKGGYQHTTISHNGRRFELKAESGKYSFVMDGEELNVGGTLKIQLVLVKNHIGVTPFSMSVLQGEKKFPEMSVQDRKDWFNEISSISYDYAFGLFNRAKSRLRDLNGSIRIANARLVDMKRDSVDKTTYSIAIKRRESILALQNAIRISMPMPTDVKDPKAKIKSLQDKIKTIGNLETTSQRDVSALERDDEILTSRIIEVSSQIDELQSRSRLDMGKLETELNEASKERDSILTNLPFQCNPVSIKEFLVKNLDKVKYFADKYDTLYIDFSQSDLNELIYKRDAITVFVNKYSIELSEVNGKVKILEENKNKDEVECPSCQTKFKAGYDETHHTHALTMQDKLNEKLTKEKDTLLYYNKKIDAINEFITIRDEFRIALSSQPELYEFLVSNNVTSNLNMVLSFIPEINKLIELEADIKDIEKDIEVSSRTNEDNEKISKAKLELLESNLVTLTTDASNVKATILTAKQNNKLLAELDILQTKLDSEMGKVDTYIESEIDKMRLKSYEYLLEETTKYNNELAETIRKYEQTNLLIDNLSMEIQEYKSKAIAVKEIVDNLSPTTGLIGESLSGFVNAFLSRVNKLIKSVWGYDMSISYSHGDNLTYTFPVLLNGEAINSDIAETSSGMQEIINLAFILASVDVSGLSVPIYLDEFAKALDESHRRSVVDMIKQIKNQMFIISHYNDLIYPFTSGNADATISVLDSNNIETSNLNRFNDHITMK